MVDDQARLLCPIHVETRLGPIDHHLVAVWAQRGAASRITCLQGAMIDGPLVFWYRRISAASSAPCLIQWAMFSCFQCKASCSEPRERRGTSVVNSTRGGNAGWWPKQARNAFTKGRSIAEGISGRAFSATIRVAPSSTAAHTGSGFSRPPSIYQRPSMRCGKEANGTAQDARR
jgi:hypothetical protein